MSPTCNVCGSALDAPVYRSAEETSISSLSALFPIRTIVYFCGKCGHLQTPPLERLEEYYDKAYRIHLESEDADQLYQSKEGPMVFRSEHQAIVLDQKLSLPEGARVLDYGCGKAPTMRRLKARRPDLQLHLFDVSDAYENYWHAFTSPELCACYAPSPDWSNRFDVVTSFYALEHVGDLHGALATMHGLLKPGGTLYAIVPYWPTNIADMIVVDHIHHFSQGSLRHALHLAGFEVMSMDADAHYGALVVLARKVERAAAPPPLEGSADLAAITAKVTETAAYWQDIVARVRDFERVGAKKRRAAIYGSGVYGSFIAAALADIDDVVCVLDQNPHQHGRSVRGRPVVAPADLPADVSVVYVGLNPAIAQREMAKVTAWSGREIHFFYL